MKKNNKNSGLSGHFVLRVTPQMHGALKDAAAKADLSLNDLCKKILEENIHGEARASAFTDLLNFCHEFFQDQLVGLAIYGSWARGTATGESDIDALVALRPDTTIDRQLYARWDAASRAVDPRFQVNFARLPEGKALSSLWCEIAVDGIVLFERDFQLSRHLISVRHGILAGQARRQVSHGQPYWIFEEDVS